MTTALPRLLLDLGCAGVEVAAHAPAPGNDRLGIADELGMPTHAGSPAWLIAVGESMQSQVEENTP